MLKTCKSVNVDSILRCCELVWSWSDTILAVGFRRGDEERPSSPPPPLPKQLFSLCDGDECEISFRERRHECCCSVKDKEI